MHLRIFFHDRCFDGVASAALFARFHREVVAPLGTFTAQGLSHREGDPFEAIAFDADDHACVDFRWSPHPALRWWFDHHKTAFQPPSLQALFEERRPLTHWFDPAAPSCAGLIARVLGTRYQWAPPPALADVVAQAEILDALAFATPQEAVADTPANRLASYLTSTPDDLAPVRCIEHLADGMPLDTLASRPEVRDVVEPVLAARDAGLRLLAGLARPISGAEGDPGALLVVLDLIDVPPPPEVRLAGYVLYPASRYVVTATRTDSGIRLSAGHNPWCGTPRRHDVGALCQSLGGGGHAAVGGVTLAPHETSRARAALTTMIETLQRP